MKDISVMLGSNMIINDNNYDIHEENLGSCRIITLSEMETIIVGPNGDKSEINQYMNDLKDFIKLNEKSLEEEELKNYIDRLNCINQNTCLISIGGATEVEKNNFRDKLVDCINSCRNAFDNGVVMGGCNTYLLFNFIIKDIVEEIISNNNKYKSFSDKNYCILFDKKQMKWNFSEVIEDIKSNKNVIIFDKEELNTLDEIIKNMCSKINDNESFKLGINVFRESLYDLIRQLYIYNTKSGDFIINSYYQHAKNIILEDKDIFKMGFNLHKSKN